MELWRRIYQKVVPVKTRNAIRRQMYRYKENRFRKIIMKYCLATDDPEKKEIGIYLTKHKLNPFPYEYIHEYQGKEMKVHEEDGMKYVLYQGKRMYMRPSMSNIWISQYTLAVMSEQDKRSPHAYFLEKEREISEGDVVADIGCAEGNFSLDIIEKAGKIYLFESDEEWISCIERTFSPWKDKIEIVRKYVCDEDTESTVSLDSFFRDKRIDVIKADVEGAEEKLLKGARETLSKVKKVFLCAYHQQGDEAMIKRYLSKSGFNYRHNPGYMIFYKYNKTGWPEYPYLRRGVIYGEKAVEPDSPV